MWPLVMDVYKADSRFVIRIVRFTISDDKASAMSSSSSASKKKKTSKAGAERVEEDVEGCEVESKIKKGTSIVGMHIHTSKIREVL